MSGKQKFPLNGKGFLGEGAKMSRTLSLIWCFSELEQSLYQESQRCTRRVEMRNHVGKDVRPWVPHGQVLHTVLQQMHSLGYHGHGVDEHHVLFGVEIVRNSVSVEIRPCFVS